MIKVTDLTKSYGPIEALRGVSFNIKSGEIVGLLGPNGAGKTTIIKTLTGYLQPDRGSLRVADMDVLSQTLDVQARIGYLPESAPLYPELNVQTYLKMIADLRQIPQEKQQAMISDAVLDVGLEDYLTRPIGQLSKGFRQRVGLAQAILHRPDLLILDEPTVGLDPTQIVEIRRLIKRLSKNSTILFSTHILSEVEALCDRAIILMNGLIKADAYLADLAKSTDVILVLDKEISGVSSSLKGIGGVEKVEILDVGAFPAYRIRGGSDADLSSVVYKMASEKQWPLRELRRDVRTLEMVFNDLAVAS